MPPLTDHGYQSISVTPIATIGAYVNGVDFSKPVAPAVYDQIYEAITKVSLFVLVKCVLPAFIEADHGTRTFALLQ